MSAYVRDVAGDSTSPLPRPPERGLDDLHDFASLQRQVAEREVPLATRLRRRRRARARRITLRLVLVLVPLVVVALVATDAAGSRTWLQDRWHDVTKAATTDQSAPGYSVGTPVRAS
jgi:hypothetical protein